MTTKSISALSFFGLLSVLIALLVTVNKLKKQVELLSEVKPQLPTPAEDTQSVAVGVVTSTASKRRVKYQPHSRSARVVKSFRKREEQKPVELIATVLEPQAVPEVVLERKWEFELGEKVLFPTRMPNDETKPTLGIYYEHPRQAGTFAGVLLALGGEESQRRLININELHRPTEKQIARYLPTGQTVITMASTPLNWATIDQARVFMHFDANGESTLAVLKEMPKPNLQSVLAWMLYDDGPHVEAVEVIRLRLATIEEIDKAPAWVNEQQNDSALKPQDEAMGIILAFRQHRAA